MRFFLMIVRFIAGLGEPESGRPRRRVDYKPSGETLEIKIVQSQFAVGAHAIGASVHETARPVVGSAGIYQMRAADASTPAGMGMTGGVRMISLTQDVAGNFKAAAIIATPVDSVRIDPKDPGGIDLRERDDSVRIDPKDPGGIDLTWVDSAVVNRPGGK